MGSGDRIVSATLINKRTAENLNCATDGLFSSSLISTSHLFLNLHYKKFERKKKKKKKKQRKGKMEEKNKKKFCS